MGLFHPSSEARYEEAARAIAPYGFVTDPARASLLRNFQPLAELSEPDHYKIAAFGRIEDADVAAFEYAYSYKDSEGRSHSSTRLVIVVAHPMIAGSASLSPDGREWDAFQGVLDVIFWIPPFTFLKAIQLLNESRNPDIVVGHAEFDRLYLVHAASEAAAREAFTAELRDLLPRIGFRGTLELRPGYLLFTVHGARFDEQTLPNALGHVAPLLAALVRPDDYPYR